MFKIFYWIQAIQFINKNDILKFKILGIDETVRVVRAIGGSCTGYKVDISKKEDVYKAADAIRRDVGNVN